MLAFFVVATLIGCVVRIVVGVRLRAAARRAEATDGAVCALEHARRITSAAIAMSLAGLALAGLASVVVFDA